MSFMSSGERASNGHRAHCAAGSVAGSALVDDRRISRKKACRQREILHLASSVQDDTGRVYLVKKSVNRAVSGLGKLRILFYFAHLWARFCKRPTASFGSWRTGARDR